MCDYVHFFQIDVYSFGVLLLEMCVGELPAIEKREEHKSKVTNREFKKLMESCVQPKTKKRPDMQEIIKMLETCFDNQTKKQGADLSKEEAEITQPLKDVAEKSNKQKLSTENGTTKAETATAKKQYPDQESPDWVISRDQIQLTENILGKGSWRIVVEGKYCGCAVAVKHIREFIVSPLNRSLFEREVDTASRCRHPCLLQFIGATNDEGIPLFVTELMQTSLRALLEERSLSTTEVLVISLDVARALNYLHKKEPSPIILSEIESANVLLWRQGDQWRGKVSYYGTADLKQHAKAVFTPRFSSYTAPEALTTKPTVKVSE